MANRHSRKILCRNGGLYTRYNLKSKTHVTMHTIITHTKMHAKLLLIVNTCVKEVN